MGPSALLGAYYGSTAYYVSDQRGEGGKLQQEEISLLYSTLKAQEDNYVKGDWFSESQQTLKEFEINVKLWNQTNKQT